VFLTPCKITHGHFEPALDGVKAARFYTIQPEGLVSTTELKKIQEISWFAKAAYGLQTSKWNGAKTGKWHKDSFDWLLSCFKSCAPRKVLRSHFQKRNMNAIVEYTKVDPSDILYVSYTSTPLGIIPYMILLDRESKNVVITIRGTVGFSDLITDLLGKSEDARPNLPAWVLDEVSKSMTDEESQQDVDLYVHTGIMSSAKAVLKDLESNNLIEAVETVLQSNAYSESETAQKSPDLNNLDDEDEIILPLDRAQSVIHEKLNTKGWRLLVTGHSLGAAVASLVSFHLYEKFPTLSCIAFNPPGGVMDPHLSVLSQKFCTSLVVRFRA
jgi:sn1-specific diacylglycerol lipase